MKKLDEVYVATDNENFYDTEGHIYNLTIGNLEKIGFSEEEAKQVCENLNRYAYPGMIKAMKLEIFAKIDIGEKSKF